MSTDSEKRTRIAYEAFRGALIPGLDPEVPSWKDAPNWIRDVALVAYLQGKLDGPPRPNGADVNAIALKAAQEIEASEVTNPTQRTARVQTVIANAIKSALSGNKEYDAMLATGVIPESLKHRFR